MANGHIENRDPLSNHNNLKSSTGCDPKSTSDMEDTVEFRILMAYAKRRRPERDSGAAVVGNGTTDANGTAPSQTRAKSEKKATNKKKKKGWRRVLRILQCVNPQTEEKELHQPTEELDNVKFRCGDFKDGEKEDELAELASRLTKLADDIPFTPPEIEPDSPENDEKVEKLIGLILRESGDRLNEKELKDIAMAKEFFWNYGFFKTLMTTVLERVNLKSPNPESPGPHASPKTQIAATCEATSRLSAWDTMPTSKVFGFGAQYLNEYFSDWAKKHGGYEAAFEEDDDEVE